MTGCGGAVLSSAQVPQEFCISYAYIIFRVHSVSYYGIQCVCYSTVLEKYKRNIQKLRLKADTERALCTSDTKPRERRNKERKK